MEEVSGIGEVGKLVVPLDLAESELLRPHTRFPTSTLLSLSKQDLFRHVLSLDTWQNVLTDEERNNLKLLLPRTDNDEETVKCLFSGHSKSDPLSQAWKSLFGASAASKSSQKVKEKSRQHQVKSKRALVRSHRSLFVSRKKLALTDKTYSKLLPDCKGPHSNLLSKMNRKYRKALLDCTKDSGITNSSSSSENEGANDQSRSEQAYMRMLKKHKKRRIENIHLPELDTSDVTLKSIVARTDPKLLNTYADVIDRVDKEPPFDLHSYLAPPSTTTTTTPSAASAATAEANNVTTSSSSSGTTATSQPSTEKPKKEASKPKLTNYTIQPSTDAERKLFRLQETERYENPHKAYTYNIRSIESTVGPVKGIYKKDQGNHSKVREHFLLKSSRPHYVTILSIVRDSASRLPESGGTRADICMLVRDSQYIVEDATDSQVHAAVSGALDRLHYEKDPCVKYDSSKKVWVYLHRSRTRDEFEQIHLAGAHAATSQKKGQKPAKAPTSSARLSISPAASSSKKKTKSIRIPQPPHQPSPTAKSSLLSATQEPITGSLLLDTSDIQLGEVSNVFKLESASQPVQSNTTEQSLDLMLSDSTKLTSSMMDIPLHNSTLPPDAIFSSDDNSSSNDFMSDTD